MAAPDKAVSLTGGSVVQLRLFVAGRSARSARAIEVVEDICRQFSQESIELEVIDVIEDPDRAEREKVLATPTLVRHKPGPPRRLVGELADIHLVIRMLGLQASNHNGRRGDDGRT